MLMIFVYVVSLARDIAEWKVAHPKSRRRPRDERGRFVRVS